MSKIRSMFSRRAFMKGVGVVAATAWLPREIYAANIDNISRESASHKILTCNIRVALPEDEQAGFGWKSRKEICIEVMRSEKPDIICMQEVLEVQNEDLKKAFPNFFSYGFEGPEMDAFKEGYHGIAKNPIFFSKIRYELISAGNYWLSETPLVAGSKSWDTARARNTSWVRLKDKKSGKQFRVVNTHLDHKSQPAREMQVKMIVDEAAQYQPEFHQILTGDFNAGSANKVYEIVKTGGWNDTYTSVHGNAEPGFTGHGFKGENYPKKDTGRKIDFIFSLGNVKAVSSAILKGNKNGRYPSDHYFVSAEVNFS